MGGRTRLIAAGMVGVALIAFAFFERGRVVTADTDLEDPRAFVAQLPLREYQEPKDTDGDGLRDWLEELTGTDPNVNDAARIASTTASSGPFVVDTETKRFAISFFKEMMAQHKGKGLTKEEEQAIITKSLREFRSLNKDTVYTRVDLTVAEDISIRDYGNSVGEAILNHNNKGTIEHELVILGRALEKDDPTLIKDMSIIRDNYDQMTAAVKAVPVPPAAFDAHLQLLNSLQAVRDDVAAFEKVFEDPLISFLRVKRYQSDAVALGKSFEAVRKVLESDAVVYTNDEPGQLFFSIRP